MLEDITAIVINWRTIDLVALCVQSLLRFYPQIELILVDNDSKDESSDWIRSLAKKEANISAVMNIGHRYQDAPLARFPKLQIRPVPGYEQVIDFLDQGTEQLIEEKVYRGLFGDGNVGHGPALHQALMLTKTRLALALDSDCEVLAGGFLEEMHGFFRDERVYAVGRKMHLCRLRGNPIREGDGFDHIHESVILLDLQKYRSLLPYVHFGVPSIINMPDATRHGFHLVDYPIGMADSAVDHRFLGSRKRFKSIPKLRSIPYLPRVLLEGLRTEFIGRYF